ncbi:hypothetical protein [Streptomyces sp. NPDC088812]|uniref:hypothetical protein n=1 Tax=Streptomyces sp. NPDC088812 TaxID=3365905 RepID=UPI003804E769
MTDHMRPVNPSAVRHADRIRARDAKRVAEQDSAPTSKSTAELYAARILPGYQRDEELREAARLGELRARGTWVPTGEETDDEGEQEPQASTDPLDNPERRSARAAWRSASTGGYLAF